METKARERSRTMVASPALAWLVTCTCSLFVLSLGLHRRTEAGCLALAAGAGVAAAWLLEQRPGHRETLLATGWVIVAGVASVVPGCDRGFCLMAVPPALWLLADTFECGAPPPRRIWALLLSFWLMLVLVVAEQSSWMLVFTAAAAPLLAAGGRWRSSLGMAAVAILGVVIVSGVGATRRGVAILEMWKPCSSGHPTAWLMVTEGGWCGRGSLHGGFLAAAPSLSDAWGWIGLGFACLFLIGMVGSAVALCRSQPPDRTKARALAAGLTGLMVAQIALHAGLILGLRLHLLSLPGIGSAAETFVLACLVAMLWLSRRPCRVGIPNHTQPRRSR